MLRQCCFILTTLLFTIVLPACSGNGTKWNPDDYTVKSGDTVYSIAWRYELDPDEFADWNNLGSSGLIKPGQRLHTRKPANYNAAKSRAGEIAYAPAAIESERSPEPVKLPAHSTRTSSSSNANKTPGTTRQTKIRARKGDTLYAISRRTGVNVQTLAQLNQLKKPYTIQPGQTIFLKPLNTAGHKPGHKTAHQSASKTSTAAKHPKTGSRSAQTKSQSYKWPKSVRWQKPASGKVIKKFNRRRNDSKGIDIAGKEGDAIVAAAGGKVVYSGDGLISYGNLVIIKHNKTYLSAYAYNRRLLVKEGDVVKAGQKIAEMGHKDKQSTRLHFEIRKNGKPVDPLKYLPW